MHVTIYCVAYIVYNKDMLSYLIVTTLYKMHKLVIFSLSCVTQLKYSYVVFPRSLLREMSQVRRTVLSPTGLANHSLGTSTPREEMMHVSTYARSSVSEMNMYVATTYKYGWQ